MFPAWSSTITEIPAVSVGFVKRAGRHVNIKLSAVRSQCFAEAIEHLDRCTPGILCSLDHQRWNSTDKHRLSHATLWFAILRDIARDLASTRRMAHVDCISQVEMFRHG